MKDSKSGRGFTLWLTGLSGAGKTTIAGLLADKLRASGLRVEVLDGDALRASFSRDLGFSREDRALQIERLGFLCELLNRNDVVAIVAAITPVRSARDQVRTKLKNFVEILLECPVEVLAQRDPKGLYGKAKRGEIQSFTGVSDPYEPPLSPEMKLRTDHQTAARCMQDIWRYLENARMIPKDPDV